MGKGQRSSQHVPENHNSEFSAADLIAQMEAETDCKYAQREDKQ